MLRAVLTAKSPLAETMLASLSPETERQPPRTRISLSCSEGVLTAVFEAADATAMRAALNSYLGCMKITEDVARITGD